MWSRTASSPSRSRISVLHKSRLTARIMSSASEFAITVYVKGLARVLSSSSVAYLMCYSGTEGGRATLGNRCGCLRVFATTVHRLTSWGNTYTEQCRLVELVVEFPQLATSSAVRPQKRMQPVAARKG